MTTCIICHMEIMTAFDVQQECPNDHPVHEACLKEWITHSTNCPLCSESYAPDILDKFKEYIEEKEKAKLDEIDAQLKAEEQKEIERIAEKMVFLKFTKEIELLAEKKQFEFALDRIDAYDTDDLESYKKQNLTFLRGQINYLRGRFDIAINQLFRLVKDKFDYPDGFLYLGRAYEKLGLQDKAKWAYDRVPK